MTRIPRDISRALLSAAFVLLIPGLAQRNDLTDSPMHWRPAPAGIGGLLASDCEAGVNAASTQPPPVSPRATRPDSLTLKTPQAKAAAPASSSPAKVAVTPAVQAKAPSPAGPQATPAVQGKAPPAVGAQAALPAAAVPQANTPRPAAASGKRPAPKQPYIDKDFIDTSIQRAFYELTAAGAMPGIGYSRQERAIAGGRYIALKLKKMAEKDPNRNYILWKVGELEQQLYLEENDLSLKRQKERQKVVNHLVAAFNAETGKPRPDFAHLTEILEQMSAVDARKANEIERNIDDRNRHISREEVFRIERALVTGNLDKARIELDYCERNKALLKIPLEKYARMTAELQSKTNVTDEQRFVDAELRRIDLLIARDEVGEATGALAAVRGRLAAVKTAVSPQEYTRYLLRCDALDRSIDVREDSLVAANLAILNAKGTDTAMAYLENVLKKRDIARQKIAIVDNAIVQSVLAGPRRQEDTTMSHELSFMTQEGGDGRFSLDGVADAARRKTQAREDSIKAVEDAWARMTERERAKELKRLEKEREKERKDAEKLAREAEKKARQDAQKAAQTEKNPPLLAAAVPPTPPPQAPPAAQAPVNGKDQADRTIESIYDLLERGDAQAAYVKFQRSRESLRQFVCKEAFEMLESSIMQGAQAMQQR